jgi:hypothetical protein
MSLERASLNDTQKSTAGLVIESRFIREKKRLLPSHSGCLATVLIVLDYSCPHDKKTSYDGLSSFV